MKTEIVFLLLMGIITLASMVQTYLLQLANKQSSELIKLQQAEIKRIYKFNDEVNIFCLAYALRDAVNSEDFEMAAKCQKLIETLKAQEVK